MDDITEDELQILFLAHKKEREECRIIHRKEFNSYLTDEMIHDRKKILIKAWQANYYNRLDAIWRERSRKEITRITVEKQS